MANIFNKLFVNVSQKVTSGIPRTRKCPLDYLKQRNDKSLFLSNATPEEIEALINSLQEGKGCWALKCSNQIIENDQSTNLSTTLSDHQ